jgi:hypothetical protein
MHANVAVPARDRRRLERLARYVARPPVSTQRLSRLDDGRLLYRLKHRWRDGTTHVVFEPLELLEKLAALVPPPRFHLVRYHGILGPCASERDRVVPGEAAQAQRQDAAALRGARVEDAGQEVRRPRDPASDLRPDPIPGDTAATAGAGPAAAEASLAADGTRLLPRRLAWADLLRRVFAVDVLECLRCGGRMRLLAAIHAPDATQAILECLELPARAPPTAGPRPEASELEVEANWRLDFEAGA